MPCSLTSKTGLCISAICALILHVNVNLSSRRCCAHITPFLTDENEWISGGNCHAITVIHVATDQRWWLEYVIRRCCGAKWTCEQLRGSWGFRAPVGAVTRIWCAN